MEEQEINCKIPAADLERAFRTDKAEVAPQFDQEILQLVEQSPVRMYSPQDALM